MKPSPLVVSISPRDFSAGNVIPAGVTLSPVSYSKCIEGGSKDACLFARGSEPALWELVELLRCPVRIADPMDVGLWWGFVAGIELRVEGFVFLVDLDSMSNRVAVAYSQQMPGLGLKGGLSAYVDDADSQSAYGIKELISPLDNADVTLANQRAATLLALNRYPIPQVQADWGWTKGESVATATLRCRGWWDTLGWRHYAYEGDAVAYIDEGLAQCHFGNITASEKIAQSFVAPAMAWSVHSVTLHLKTVVLEGGSAPTDNLTLSLCADSAGAPGTVLATSVVAGTTLNTVGSFVAFTLSVDVVMVPGTTYWVTVERS